MILNIADHTRVAFAPDRGKPFSEAQYKWWAGEYAYILSVDPHAPGEHYGHNPQCFKHYLAVQARAAERDGFPSIARDIRAKAEAV